MIQVKVMNAILDLDGEEGYFDGRFSEPLFSEETLLGFRFSEEEAAPSIVQIANLENFLTNISKYKKLFFDAVRKNYSENLENYFSPEETDGMLELLQLPRTEFEQCFEKPFIKVEFEDGFVFGFYACRFDNEHGCAVYFKDREIVEIAIRTEVGEDMAKRYTLLRSIRRPEKPI